MVDVVSGSHHHLEGRDQFTARCAVPRHPKESAEAGGGVGGGVVGGTEWGEGVKRDKADLKSGHTSICLVAKNTKYKKQKQSESRTTEGGVAGVSTTSPAIGCKWRRGGVIVVSPCWIAETLS